MIFNYRKEKKLFDEEWIRLRAEYRAAGMSEQDMEKMYAFDWAWFCSRRIFISHNCELPEEGQRDSDDPRRSSLIRRYSSFSVSFDETDFIGRYQWVESVEDEKLYARLKELSREDLELLTLLVFDGYSQPEIARKMGCSQANISKKLTPLKKYLKKF